MKLGFVILLILACLIPQAFAGTWSRVDEHTLRFEGDIAEGDYARLRELFSARITEVIVTSGGGDVRDGLLMGMTLREHPVKVTVEGRCTSSCANYLFVAGQKREIRKGIVGFHGNVTACFMGPKILSDLKEAIRASAPQASEEDIAKWASANMARTEEESKWEKMLNNAAGVSQKLFDRSCTLDKGMGDGKTYNFLLPKPETFKRFGFEGIVGEQDLEFIQSLDFPVVLD